MGGCWLDGWSDKRKLILISTQVEVVIEGEVEIGKRFFNFFFGWVGV